MPTPPFQAFDRVAPPSLVGRLITARSTRAESAVKAIESRLACEASIDGVASEDVEAILQSFGVSASDIQPSASNLYFRAALWQATERSKEDFDGSLLRQLRKLLHLSEHTWMPIHEQVAMESVARLMAGHEGSRNPADNAAEIRSELARFDLPKSRYVELTSRLLIDLVVSAANVALKDGLLTPEEEDQVASLARELGIDHAQLPSTLRESIEEARREWQVLYGPIEPVPSRVIVGVGEACVGELIGEELVRKSVRVGTGYTGLTSSVRLMKGLHWRSGVFAHAPIMTESIVSRDSGHVVLTDQRVLFVGSRRSTAVPLPQIVEVVPYTDGVEIRRATGTHLLLRLGGSEREVRRFHTLLSRLLNGEGVDVAKPLEVPEELKELLDVLGVLALAIHRSVDEIPIEFKPRPGTSLNLDDCNALVRLASAQTIRALIAELEQISDLAVPVCLALLDEARVALAVREGEPRPALQLPLLLADNRKIDAYRQSIVSSLEKASVDHELSALRELVEICNRVTGTGGAKKGSGIRSATRKYADALTSVATLIQDPSGRGSRHFSDATEKLGRVLDGFR